MREPSLLPVFGKLGVKTPVIVATAPAQAVRMAGGMRALLASHGALALKVSVVAWTVLVLAAVFFIVRA